MFRTRDPPPLVAAFGTNRAAGSSAVAAPYTVCSLAWTRVAVALVIRYAADTAGHETPGALRASQ